MEIAIVAFSGLKNCLIDMIDVYVGQGKADMDVEGW